MRAAVLWGGLSLVVAVLSGCAAQRSGTGVGPYPEGEAGEDATGAIATATAEAQRTHRQVLLVFGANWCGDSRAMYLRLTEDERVAPLVRERYVLTLIDVGERQGSRWDRDVVQLYGRPFEERGIPALVILDAAGRQLTTRANNPLKDTDHRRPARLRRFLEVKRGGSVIGDRWSVVGGRWPVAGGRWAVGGGRWAVVSDRWSVIGGRFRFSTPHSQHPTAEG